LGFEKYDGISFLCITPYREVSMPVGAAVAGIAGAIASAGSAAAAVGAIATGGLATLTVGAVASIATFAGSVATVVGSVTGNKDLLKIGSIVGAAGGVTSLAANSLQVFGPSQTLSAALKVGSDVTQTAQAITQPVTLPSLSAPTVEPVADPLKFLGQPVNISAPVGTLATPAQQLTQPTLANQLVAPTTESVFSTSVAGAPKTAQAVKDMMSQFGVAAPKTPTINTPTAPQAPGVGADTGFSFDKITKFFNDNDKLLQSIGGAWKAYQDADTAEATRSLYSSHAKYYDTQAGLLQQGRYNSSAAGRLYGAR
jgi:hypothetical protein